MTERMNTAGFMQAMQHAAAHLLLAAEEEPVRAQEMRAVAAKLQLFALGSAAPEPGVTESPETRPGSPC